MFGAIEFNHIKHLKNAKAVSISLDEGETGSKNKILSVNRYVLDENYQKQAFLLGISELVKFDAETIT